MSEERKNPGTGFWITVALVLVMVYPLSLGPVVWIFDHTSPPRWAFVAIECFYRPLEWTVNNVPDSLGAALMWYLEFWGWKL